MGNGPTLLSPRSRGQPDAPDVGFREEIEEPQPAESQSFGGSEVVLRATAPISRAGLEAVRPERSPADLLLPDVSGHTSAVKLGSESQADVAADDYSIQLRFRRAGQTLPNTDISLAAHVREQLSRVFTAYAEMACTCSHSSDESGAGGAQSGVGEDRGEPWGDLRFMAIGQVVYLSPHWTPRMAKLKNGSLVRVTRRRVVLRPELDASAWKKQEEEAVQPGPKAIQGELRKNDEKRGCQVEEKDPIQEVATRLRQAVSFKEHGNILYQEKRYLEAARMYTAGLDILCPALAKCYGVKLQPEVPTLACNRSAAYLQLWKLARDSDLKAALLLRTFADAQWSVVTNPEWAKGYIRLGSVLEHMDCQEEATHNYIVGLENCPGDKEVDKLLVASIQQKKSTTRKPLKEELTKLTKLAEGHVELADREWLMKLQEDKGKRAQLGLVRPDALAALQELLVNERNVSAVVSSRVPMITKENWTSVLTESQQYDWLRDCYRMRESREPELGTSGPSPQQDSKSLPVLHFLIFCRLLQNQKLLPPFWNWTAFLHRVTKTVSSQQQQQQSLVFQHMHCHTHSGQNPTSFAGCHDHNMLAFTCTVYGCNLDEPWPAHAAQVRDNVSFQFFRWLKFKSVDVFDSIGEITAWRDLMPAFKHVAHMRFDL